MPSSASRWISASALTTSSSDVPASTPAAMNAMMSWRSRTASAPSAAAAITRTATSWNASPNTTAAMAQEVAATISTTERRRTAPPAMPRRLRCGSGSRLCAHHRSTDGSSRLRCDHAGIRRSRATSTGHGAWLSTQREVLPSSSPVKPPRPRVPTTRTEGPWRSHASISAWRASPSRTSSVTSVSPPAAARPDPSTLTACCRSSAWRWGVDGARATEGSIGGDEHELGIEGRSQTSPGRDRGAGCLRPVDTDHDAGDVRRSTRLPFAEDHHRAVRMVDDLRGDAPEKPPPQGTHAGRPEQDDVGVELFRGAQQRPGRPATNNPGPNISTLGGVVLEIQQAPLPLGALGDAVLGRRQKGIGIRGMGGVLGPCESAVPASRMAKAAAAPAASPPPSRFRNADAPRPWGAEAGSGIWSSSDMSREDRAPSLAATLLHEIRSDPHGEVGELRSDHSQRPP
jgi:hypothetical protein